MRRVAGRLRLLLLSTALCSAIAYAEKPEWQRYENAGIAVEFSIAPAEGSASTLSAGQGAIASFRFSDARTGQPLPGVRPKAWISARPSEQVASETLCSDKIRGFMAGQLSVRPDVDLNGYLLLTLNHDKSVTFINPHIGLNTTKMESIVVLPGVGADWVLSKDRNYIYVTVPESSAIVVIDTITRKVVATLSTGEKSEPRRIAEQPDGRYVWAGLDGSGQVAAIDTRTRQIVDTVSVGKGLHNIAFTGDSRFAYVTNGAADSVSAIDTGSFETVSEIPVGKTPVVVSWSKASGLIFVGSINGATVTAIDPLKQKIVAAIPVQRGVAALRFEPEGRFALAVNQVESTVTVIDSATNSVVASASVVKEPDQVSFTARYAYIRGLGTEKFSLIDLSELRKGKLAPLDIQAGRLAPSSASGEIGVADMIAPTPEGNAVMIANTADRMVYYYVEGMMAPMGALQNYRRFPRGLIVLDRSLSETAPGVFSSPVKLSAGGRFDVPVLLDQPRISHCFQIAATGPPAGRQAAARASLIVAPLLETSDARPGVTIPLKFRILDATTQKPVTGLAGVQLLALEPPGVWQQRLWLDEKGDGVYEAGQAFPHEGKFYLMLSIESRGVHFSDLPYSTLTVRSGAVKKPS